MINNRQNNRRRGRGGGPRPNGPNPGNDRSNRIDNRSRGNANQLFEKYKTLARDAQMQGDRVMSEYYFQFADHYFRVLSENRSRFEEQGQGRGRPDQMDRDDRYDYGDDGDGAPENAQPGYSDRGYRDLPVENAGDNEGEVADEPVRAYGANGHASNGHEAANGRPPVEQARNERSRRGRPRREAPSDAPLLETARDQQEERIEIDRLPPAFSGASEPETLEEKPKRRGRPRRSESAPVEV